MKNKHLKRVAMRKEHRKRANKVVIETTFFPLNADPVTFKDGVVFWGGVRSGRTHAHSEYDKVFKEWVFEFAEPKEKNYNLSFTVDATKKRLSN